MHLAMVKKLISQASIIITEFNLQYGMMTYVIIPENLSLEFKKNIFRFWLLLKGTITTLKYSSPLETNEKIKTQL